MKAFMNLLYDNRERTLESDTGVNLLTLLQKNDVNIVAPCGGKGLCGKCKIKVIDGLMEPNPTDYKFFSKKELEEGYRLACTHTIENDITIEVPFNNKLDVCTDFNNKSVDSSRMTTYQLQFSKEILSEYKSAVDYLRSKINNNVNISYKGLKDIGTIIDNAIEETVNSNIYVLGNEAISISMKEEKHYGVAIDIGTTTIAFVLIDLLNGEIKETISSLNLQNRYGQDVISRLDYAAQSDKHREDISNILKDVIEDGIKQLIKTNEYSVNLISISGNTTMIQLLLNISSKALGIYPFTILSDRMFRFKYNEIFSKQLFDCNVLITPAISAYVGGDITSGILVTDIFNSSKINILIDIGTNGEIVIGNSYKLLCTATAAGPAFEGANLKYGIGAVEGAIATYERINRLLHIDTIGNKEPIGICGTGIVDIISQLLQDRVIEKNGLFNQHVLNKDEEYIICKGKEHNITINQKDIREIQLAKAAIRAGIEILIKKYDCDYEEIDKIYIAGGFGSKINLKSAINIGLIPSELEEKAETIGNSSLSGSIQLLLDKNIEDKYNKIISISQPIDLALDEEFNKLFMGYMSF